MTLRSRSLISVSAGEIMLERLDCQVGGGGWWTSTTTRCQGRDDSARRQNREIQVAHKRLRAWRIAQVWAATRKR